MAAGIDVVGDIGDVDAEVKVALFIFGEEIASSKSLAVSGSMVTHSQSVISFRFLDSLAEIFLPNVFASSRDS